MRIFLSVLLTFLLVGSGFTRAQHIEEKASDITGVTRLVSAQMRALHSTDYPGSHATFRAEYENNPREGKNWALSFYGFAEDTTAMSETSTIRIDAEGQALEPIRVESRTRHVDDTLLEIKRAVFTRPAFEQIATAESLVTVTIGPFHFDAIHARRQDMRLILDQVPRDTPQTAENAEDSSGS